MGGDPFVMEATFQRGPGLPQSRYHDQYLHAGERLLSGGVCETNVRDDEWQGLFRKP